VRRGTLYGLGLGPGDPELLTLKALRLLKAAPVVAYPAPLGGESFARSIVAGWLGAGQEEIVIAVPMDPDPTAALGAYDAAAETISGRLEAGQDVALLCQGDPFFYGSFMYLFGRLADRHAVEVVPGVSSLTASAAALAMPLTTRNEVLTVLPAPLPTERLAEALARTDAAAIVKIGRHFPRIRTLLADMNLLDHARYVERATLDTQRILPLDAVDESAVPYFSIVLVRRERDLRR
jgi:precorrin-2/cobalt-factor-2 C20-methyltransferase